MQTPPTQTAGSRVLSGALYVPDLIAALPGGITSSQLAEICKLGGVQAVLPVDGGKVKVNGQSVNVLGVSPQAFRSWTSLSTAGSAAIWSNLGKGQLVSTGAAAGGCTSPPGSPIRCRPRFLPECRSAARPR